MAGLLRARRPGWVRGSSATNQGAESINSRRGLLIAVYCSLLSHGAKSSDSQGDSEVGCYSKRDYVHFHGN